MGEEIRAKAEKAAEEGRDRRAPDGVGEDVSDRVGVGAEEGAPTAEGGGAVCVGGGAAGHG